MPPLKIISKRESSAAVFFVVTGAVEVTAGFAIPCATLMRFDTKKHATKTHIIARYDATRMRFVHKWIR